MRSVVVIARLTKACPAPDRRDHRHGDESIANAKSIIAVHGASR
jgi:hypothetical protein